MSKLNHTKYNTEPILKEINSVIIKGLNNILSEFTENYNIYQETHTAIMNLPYVKNAIYGNKTQNCISLVSDSESDSESDITGGEITMFDSIKNMTSELVEEAVNNKFIEKNNIIKELLLEIEKLKVEIENLKYNPSEVFIKEEKEEKENIKLIIQQKESELCSMEYIVNDDVSKQEGVDGDEHGEDSDEDEEEEEEEEEDEEEEEAEEEEEEELEEEEEEEEEVDEEEEEEEEEKPLSTNNDVNIEVEVETENEKETEDEEEEEDHDNDDADDSVSKNKDEFEQEIEEEFFEIEIDDITYCTNNEDNGFIFELNEDGEIGKKIGYFKESEPFFYEDEK
uniref:Uncharacterized protein n=1 Tax=viral metagenome TaxID=1070528 RepID=A0A6C0ERG4_9ZZZZ